MTLQNAPPGLDYERDKKFSRVYILDHLYILPMLSTTYV
jgi:hypothetical protein